MKLKEAPFQPPTYWDLHDLRVFFFALSRMSPYFPIPSTFTKRCYVPILCKTFNIRDYVNNFTSKKMYKCLSNKFFYLFISNLVLFIYFNSCYDFSKVHFLLEKTHPNLWIPFCWLRFLLIPLCTPFWFFFLHLLLFVFVLHR